MKIYHTTGSKKRDIFGKIKHESHDISQDQMCNPNSILIQYLKWKKRGRPREKQTDWDGRESLIYKKRYFTHLHNELNISTGRGCLRLPLLKLPDFTCSEGGV